MKQNILKIYALVIGEHFFCSPKILGSELDTASEEDIKKPNEKFKAMCFLQRTDFGRYGDLLDDLKKSVHRAKLSTQ
mgnify:CR=1 FL=1